MRKYLITALLSSSLALVCTPAFAGHEEPPPQQNPTQKPDQNPTPQQDPTQKPDPNCPQPSNRDAGFWDYIPADQVDAALTAEDLAQTPYPHQFSHRYAWRCEDKDGAGTVFRAHAWMIAVARAEAAAECRTHSAIGHCRLQGCYRY